MHSIGVVGLSERLGRYPPKMVISAFHEKARVFFSRNLQKRLQRPISGELSELAGENPR